MSCQEAEPAVQRDGFDVSVEEKSGTLPAYWGVSLSVVLWGSARMSIEGCFRRVSSERGIARRCKRPVHKRTTAEAEQNGIRMVRNGEDRIAVSARGRAFFTVPRAACSREVGFPRNVAARPRGSAILVASVKSASRQGEILEEAKCSLLRCTVECSVVAMITDSVSLTSVLVNLALRYPDERHSFLPSEQYPEYRLGHISPEPNPVYDAVRECLLQAGLDSENQGRADWNPLGVYIEPGQRVFVLCNFVYQRRPTESVKTFQAKCTHASVLRAVIDYILTATGPTGTVTLGNAPLQSGEWSRLLGRLVPVQSSASMRRRRPREGCRP